MEQDESGRPEKRTLIELGNASEITAKNIEADQQADAEWGRVDKKMKLAGNDDSMMVCMLSISEVRLENFNITQFTELDMATLAQAGLALFVKLLAEIPSISIPDVDSFVNSYREKAREGYVQREGKRFSIQLNELSVGEALKLPTSGLKLNDLHETEFSIGDCLLPTCQPGRGADILVQKACIKPEWKKWVDLVQVWL